MTIDDDARLYDGEGRRLYLTQDERAAFMVVARTLPRLERTFCTILHDTGCRISEALALPGRRVDLAGKAVVLETLKKRRRGVYRAVPLPDVTLDTLDMVHGLSEARSAGNAALLDELLWPISRTTAWRIVKRAMEVAGIEEGPHRAPKGLRHAFGIHAILCGVPITSLRKWMGHAKLETTAIYLDAVGAESREIAARMWS
jgi:site-specific recombinase XerD